MLSCPAAGEQECMETQVLFSVELSALRTLGLVKHPFLLKHPTALTTPCLNGYSHLTLLYSQTDPAVLLTPSIVFRSPLQLLKGCWRTSEVTSQPNIYPLTEYTFVLNLSSFFSSQHRKTKAKEANTFYKCIRGLIVAPFSFAWQVSHSYY